MKIEGNYFFFVVLSTEMTRFGKHYAVAWPNPNDLLIWKQLIYSNEKNYPFLSILIKKLVPIT